MEGHYILKEILQFYTGVMTGSIRILIFGLNNLVNKIYLLERLTDSGLSI